MPWKNGRGLTEEIASFPTSSGVETFDWRLSMARVASDGPFSLFPEVDRSTTLLEGDGLELELPDGRTVALTPGGAPFSFPGEWEISGRNVGGTTVDLNIMTRRGRYAHDMWLLGASGRHSIEPKHLTLITATGPASIRRRSEHAYLRRFDTLQLDKGGDFDIEPGKRADILAPAVLVVISLRAVVTAQHQVGPEGDQSGSDRR